MKDFIEIQEEVKIGNIVLEKGDKIKIVETPMHKLQDELRRYVNELFNQGAKGGRIYADFISNTMMGMSNTPFMESFMDSFKGQFVGW